MNKKIMPRLLPRLLLIFRFQWVLLNFFFVGASFAQSQPSILEGLKSPDDCYSAMAVLRKTGTATELERAELLKIVLQGGARQSRVALDTLLIVCPGNILEDLKTALSDPNPIVRTKAIEALGVKIDYGKNAIPELIQALLDPEPEVRLGAVQAIFVLNKWGVFNESAKDGVTVLIKLLGDSELDVRLNAIVLLASLGESGIEATPDLLKAMSDSEPMIRRNAAYAIYQQNKIGTFKKYSRDAVKQLINLLSDPEADLRSMAALVLVEFGTEAELAVPEIIKRIISKPDERDEFAKALVVHREITKTAVPEFVKFVLTSEETEVRDFFVRLLVRFEESAKDAVPLLLEALKGPDSRVAWRAAYALGQLKRFAKDMVPLLTDALKDTDSTVRRRAVEILKDLSGSNELLEIVKDSAPGLIKALSDSEVGARLWAAEALGHFGGDAKNAIPVLVRLALADPNGLVRLSAGRALGCLSPYAAEVFPVFLGALSDPSAEVRSRAVRALGFLKADKKRILAELAKIVFSDPEWDVRKSALRALVDRKEDAQEVVLLLKKLLSDPNPEVQQITAQTLGEFGVLAKDALPELRIASSSPDPNLRELANEALIQIIGVPPLQMPNSNSRPGGIFEESNLSLSDAMSALVNHDSWNSLAGYASEYKTSTDAWDIAMHSIRALFLSKIRLLSGSDRAISGVNSLQTFVEFSKSLSALLERGSLKNNPDWSGVDIYAKIYRILILREAGQPEDQWRAALEADLITLNPNDGRDTDSAFNTYAWGAALVALAPKIPGPILKKAKDWVDRQPDPMRLPYDFESVPAVSRQASAARNITMHLALYLSADSQDLEEKIKRRNNLFEAIEVWHLYAGNLSNEVGRDFAHQGPHKLAPYYFYSSLPYATSALKILARDPNVDQTQKSEILLIKKELRISLPKLMSKVGLGLIPGGKNYLNTMYYSSPAYAYPLYGLALLSLLEPEDDEYTPSLESDFGIVCPPR